MSAAQPAINAQAERANTAKTRLALCDNWNMPIFSVLFGLGWRIAFLTMICRAAEPRTCAPHPDQVPQQLGWHTVVAPNGAQQWLHAQSLLDPHWIGG
jgi:hypothetical protein